MVRYVLISAFLSGVAFAGVTVSAPANGSQVSTSVQYTATATTSCSKGVSAIGVYSAPGVLAYSTSGSSLNHQISFSPGTYETTVQSWDNCGGSAKTPITIYVSSAAAQVQVTAPTDNSNVSGDVQYTATSTTGCSKGISAMGIYTSPGVLAYTSQGASLNTTLSLNAGTYQTVVQEWDNCGGSTYTPVTITVGGSSSGGQVTVTEPKPNSNVGSSVQFIATATSSCSKGISAMGIYTSAGVLAYTTGGASLNTTLSLSPGTYHTVVEDWDNCGGASTAPITITVGSGGGGGTTGTFTNLHQEPGWNGYGLLPPDYGICSSCSPAGPKVSWSMTQNISSPSRSGNATKMDIGGTTDYADVLWNNHLIGNFSTQGMPDYDQTIIPNLYNFTYDVYFYIEDLGASQALEFDINEFVGGKSYIWGHECRIDGGNEWDIWDNPGKKWHPTGASCKPLENAWNHLVLQVQRTSDNRLLFQSITLNGVTSTLNYYSDPTDTSWYGVTINYQQDGDSKQSSYSVWLDQLNFSYW